MTLSRTLLAGAFGAALLFAAAPAARAAQPAAPAKANPLAQAVAQGAHLFSQETFGGNGKTCESCHAGGGKIKGLLPNGRRIPSLRNAAAIFPRYNKRADQVVTLEMQIGHCIQGALQGKPPAAGSPEMVAMQAYLGSIAKGQKIQIGGKPE